MIKVEGKTIYKMCSQNAPASTGSSGETYCFSTQDCYGGQVVSADTDMSIIDYNKINPATGPLYVQGALPGDILKIHINHIQVDAQGVMCAKPEKGVLGSIVTEPQVKIIPIVGEKADFGHGLLIPVDPMIGVVGVAPAGTDAIGCGNPGSHGGNMDNKRIRAGATLYLPVFHPGALLAMGDVHALMGDGESMMTGLEIPAKITVTVDVIKGPPLENPMLEDDEYCYTIGSAPTLDEAIFLCTKDMCHLVQRQLGLSFNEAGMLLSAVGDLKICQVVNSKKTASMAVPKSVMAGLMSCRF